MTCMILKRSPLFFYSCLNHVHPEEYRSLQDVFTSRRLVKRKRLFESKVFDVHRMVFNFLPYIRYKNAKYHVVHTTCKLSSAVSVDIILRECEFKWICAH